MQPSLKRRNEPPRLYTVLASRTHSTLGDERARYNRNPFKNRYGVYHHSLIVDRLGRALTSLLNRVVCTRCWHWRSLHWYVEDVDDGCNVARCNC